MDSKFKSMPSLATDEDVERFVAAADLSSYDLSDFKPVKHSDLMMQEEQEVIENHKTEAIDQLTSVKQRIVGASADGSIQMHIRNIVADNRRKAEHHKNS